MKGYKRQFIAVMCIVGVLLVAMVSYTFVAFYETSRDNIQSLGESNLAYESEGIENYIQRGKDVVWITGDSVESMIESGATNEEILTYLTKQSEHQIAEVDPNFTGIYGYVRGEYLDGTGWEPPEGYIPQQRDWYIAALEGHGDTVLVAPYLDAKTHTIMVSVSQLLDDGESVISLDIALNQIQDITANIKMNSMGYGFIIDNTGLVVAHYDEGEKGKIYPEFEEQEILIKRILGTENSTFQTKVDNEKCTVFTKEVLDDWHVVMVVSNTKLFKSIRNQLLIQAIVCVLVFAVVILFCLVAYNNLAKYQRREEESRKALDTLNSNVIKALAYTIDAKDRYTSGHSQRVAEYSLEIAKRMGKSKEEQQEIYYAGLLHDVGKIRVPEDVINKPGKLTDDEFNQIKIHPVSGYHILKDIYTNHNIAIGAKYHHEKYNGTGYPNGLEQENIPEIARIIGVADAYDAMASNRSYRDALPQNIVRDEIVKGKGTQFDPNIADVMLEMMDEDRDYSLRQHEREIKTILIVDDERVNLIMARGILKQDEYNQDKYNILTAKSIDEALEVLSENKVSLVLLDLMMPGVEGFEGYDRIRSEYEDVPIVFMTADKSLDTIKKAKVLGVDDYITKPFIPVILRETVHGIINTWK